MSTTLATTPTKAEDLANLLIKGDVSRLTPDQKLQYIAMLCERTGLDAMLMPFQLLNLGGKEVVYATKSATEQLRKLHGISVVDITSTMIEEILIVTCKVQDRDGRTDVATGAVPLPATLKGEARSNAIMKAETKAKRRATLSLAGLGILDESETDSIKGAVRIDLPALDGSVQAALPPAAEPVARVLKDVRVHHVRPLSHNNISWAEVTLITTNGKEIILPTSADHVEAALSVFEQIPQDEPVTITTDVGPRNKKERICKVERKRTQAAPVADYDDSINEVGF